MIPAVVQAAVAAATRRADAEIVLRMPEAHQSNELFDVWLEGFSKLPCTQFADARWKAGHTKVVGCAVR